MRIDSARCIDDTGTPSPLVGEGWGEGASQHFTLSLALPHQGGGNSYEKVWNSSSQINRAEFIVEEAKQMGSKSLMIGVQDGKK